ncbi:MAG: cupin domain-containing protein [Chloroflexi bacterium]|nr:cupin domain-containing protein [Chloroflexota bacterium]
MSSQVVVNAKANRRHSAGANRDMERDIGISRDATGSQNIYSAIVITVPGGKTDSHHHAECETAIYILKGRALYRFGDRLEQVVTAAEGDFVYIPAHAIHTEENLSEVEELHVLVTRNCPGPKTIVVPYPTTGTEKA